MKFLRAALLAVLPIIMTTAALAQSNPGFFTGQVPTASQWNAAFSAKQDYSAALTAIANGTTPVTLFSSTVSGTVPASGGGTANFLRADGVFAAPPASPPCTTTALSVQYNNAGVLGCVSGAISNGTTMQFTDGDFLLENSAVTGGVALHASATTGHSDMTFPIGTDTLVGIAATQTLTNKTLTAPVMTAPVLNTIASGVGTALTALNASNITTGTIPAAQLPLGSTSAFGAVKCDGTSVLCTAGVISAVGSGNANFATATGNVAGHVVTLSNSTTGLQDSGIVATNLALNGIGAILASNPTLTAAQYNTQCPIYTINAASLNIALPSAATLQANGGCLWVLNPASSANTYTLTPNGSDTLNTVAGASTIRSNSLVLVTTNGSNALFVNSPPAAISLSAANVWSAQQSNSVTALTIATSTFTPTGASNNYSIGLTSACPCTLANQATLVPGTSGVMAFTQDGTGSRTITTWGSQYVYQGGTSTILLSTAANATDIFSYYDIDSGHRLLTQGASNAVH